MNFKSSQNKRPIIQKKIVFLYIDNQTLKSKISESIYNNIINYNIFRNKSIKDKHWKLQNIAKGNFKTINGEIDYFHGL